MSDKTPFYITTPIFYPNGKLHIGNAYPTVVCDVFARLARILGRPTFFLTGADENSLKVEKAAKEKGLEVMDFLNAQASETQQLFARLHIAYDRYIRTTDTVHHHLGVQEMWKRLEKSGDIYEGIYEGLYCVGCESFKTEKDLVDGKCPLHDAEPEKVKEKNYFFKLSKYTSKIIQAIESGELYIAPEARKNEILTVLREGLDDISFSRPYHGQPNAIVVPGDDSQAVYVWGDALTNYISALGFGGSDDSLMKRFWPEAVHVIGKDILRFHAAIWPGMLMSAGLSLPQKILVTGLMQSGGKKMSKTLGNVIDPVEMVDIVGAEGLRFYFTHDVPLLDDGEVSKELIVASYNAHLANGIGNLCNRLLKMMITYDARFDPAEARESLYWKEVEQKADQFLNTTDLTGYTSYIWKELASIDVWIQETEPFKLFKTDPEKAQELVSSMMEKFYILTNFAEPVLPYSAPKIIDCIEERKMPDAPMFMKIG